jgi:hypothetical protein
VCIDGCEERGNLIRGRCAWDFLQTHQLNGEIWGRERKKKNIEE